MNRLLLLDLVLFKAGQELAVYVDGDHEFVVFDPQSSETHELSLTGQQNLATIEETGQLGYASVYGELPEFELKSKDDELWEATAPSRPSERPGMFMLSCFELMVGHKNPSILHHNGNSLAVAFSVSALAHQCLASLQRSYFDRLAHQGLALVLLRQPHSLFVLLLLSRPPSDILTDLRFQSHAVLALNQSVCHSCQESDDHAQGHSIGSPYLWKARSGEVNIGKKFLKED
ncbi:hypothetical protein G4B88_020667 [Cannabis sativa]|uniref:Uncharacterized protein n=1 Tax=Cannabis sativa TaxID=3483 RepID=A0A7J6HNN9_CANSA|nr:hypothetical protein G4B88_020667 [Cannabis sativa]